MLKALRHRGLQRKIFIGLAIAIIPSFVLWGVMMNQEDAKTSGALGKIGRRSIMVQDYLNSYRAVQHQLQFMFGERWGEMRRYVNLKGEAWDRILLLEEAHKRGLRTPDSEVIAWISSQPSFQRKGQYYPELYRMAVREALRMEPRDFEEEMRQTLTVQKLTQSLVSGIKLDDAELKALYQKEKAVRDIEYIILPGDSSDAALKIDDKEIEEVYGIVKDKLTEPEKVQLKFLKIAKEEAEAKKDLLADGSGTLDAIAAKGGLSVQSTGYFSRNDAVPDIGLSQPILEAAFQLPIGGESSWIEFDGAHFKIKVADKKPERSLTLDESREELRKKVLEEKAMEAAAKRLEGVKSAADTAGLEAAAQTLNLKVQTFDSFKPDAYIPGIGPARMIANTLAALKEGQVSAPVAVAGGAALVRIKKDHAVDDAAFQKDKDSFKKDVSSRKAQEVLQDLLQKLRKDLTLNTERMKEIFPDEETPAIS